MHNAFFFYYYSGSENTLNFFKAIFIGNIQAVFFGFFFLLRITEITGGGGGVGSHEVY